LIIVIVLEHPVRPIIWSPPFLSKIGLSDVRIEIWA